MFWLSFSFFILVIQLLKKKCTIYHQQSDFCLGSNLIQTDFNVTIRKLVSSPTEFLWHSPGTRTSSSIRDLSDIQLSIISAQFWVYPFNVHEIYPVLSWFRNSHCKKYFIFNSLVTLWVICQTGKQLSRTVYSNNESRKI